MGDRDLELLKKGLIDLKHTMLFKHIAQVIHADWYEYLRVSQAEKTELVYEIPIAIEFHHGTSDDMYALRRYYNSLEKKTLFPKEGLPEVEQILCRSIEFGNPDIANDASRLTLARANRARCERLYNVQVINDEVMDLQSIKFPVAIDYAFIFHGAPLLEPIGYETRGLIPSPLKIYQFLIKPEGVSEQEAANITSWRKLFCSPIVYDVIKDEIDSTTITVNPVFTETTATVLYSRAFFRATPMQEGTYFIVDLTKETKKRSNSGDEHTKNVKKPKSKLARISPLCNCTPLIKSVTRSGTEIELATCHHMCKPFNFFAGDMIIDERCGHGFVKGIGLVQKKNVYFMTPFFKFDTDTGCTFFNNFWAQKITLYFRPKYDISIEHQNAKFALDVLQMLLKDDTSKDITLFHNDEESIRCHKVILCNRSDYFKVMLSDDKFIESTKDKINIQEEYWETFKSVILFIYGNPPIINQDNILAYSNMASKYAIKDLSTLCQQTLCDLFSIENIMDITNLILKEEDIQCFDSCCRFIREHYSELSNDAKFKLFLESKDILVQRLKEFLTRTGALQNT